MFTVKGEFSLWAFGSNVPHVANAPNPPKSRSRQQKRGSNLQLIHLQVVKHLPHPPAVWQIRQLFCERNICTCTCSPHAQQRKRRRCILFHSPSQTNGLVSATEGKSWWVGWCPLMCYCKTRLPLLTLAKNSQTVPRNTVCSSGHLFYCCYCCFTVTNVVYEQTSSHAEISGLVIKKYTKHLLWRSV